MADEVIASGEIGVRISLEDISGGGGGPGDLVGGAPPGAPGGGRAGIPKKPENTIADGIIRGMRYLAIPLTLFAIARSSKIISETTGAFGSIIGAMIDILLYPLVGPVVEALKLAAKAVETEQKLVQKVVGVIEGKEGRGTQAAGWAGGLLGGILGGAALGTLTGGPIGTIIGALVGAAAGTVVGAKVAEFFRESTKELIPKPKIFGLGISSTGVDYFGIFGKGPKEIIPSGEEYGAFGKRPVGMVPFAPEDISTTKFFRDFLPKTPEVDVMLGIRQKAEALAKRGGFSDPKEWEAFMMIMSDAETRRAMFRYKLKRTDEQLFEDYVYAGA